MLHFTLFANCDITLACGLQQLAAEGKHVGMGPKQDGLPAIILRNDLTMAEYQMIAYGMNPDFPELYILDHSEDHNYSSII